MTAVLHTRRTPFRKKGTLKTLTIMTFKPETQAHRNIKQQARSIPPRMANIENILMVRKEGWAVLTFSC